MVTRKKAEGIELLKPKQDPVSIQEITLMDWYAGFALMGGSSAREAFEKAEDMLKERSIRIGDFDD